MSDIGKGDWVECVNDGGMAPIVVVGRVYFVEALDEVYGIPCLILTGVVHPTRGFRRVRADHFRPLRRPPNPDLIESLKRPAREPVKEDA